MNFLKISSSRILVFCKYNQKKTVFKHSPSFFKIYYQIKWLREVAPNSRENVDIFPQNTHNMQ